MEIAADAEDARSLVRSITKAKYGLKPQEYGFS
jgi:hypothetical protein